MQPRPFEQDGYGGVPGCCHVTHPPCGYCHHTLICHIYHVKHTCKKCNLDSLKGETKVDTNETPTCVVPCTSHRQTLFGREEEGTIKALLYTLPRGVEVGCLRVLMNWFVCTCSVVLSLEIGGTSPGVCPGQAVYNQNRKGYEVQWCGWEGGRSDVLFNLLHAKLICCARILHMLCNYDRNPYVV